MSRWFRNLHPNDPVSRFERAHLEYKDGKWLEVAANRKVAVRSATGHYLFVVLEGVIYVGRASWITEGRFVWHIDLLRGQNVEYAGEGYFGSRKKRGILRRWNNASGHYQPSRRYAHQAGLPIEYFQHTNFPSPSQEGIPGMR